MIYLENVSKWFPTNNGRKYILKNVSLTIPEGKNVGIVGRNGSGKTTLMRMIGGIETPNEGSISSKSKISPPFGMKGGFAKMLTGLENSKFVCRIQGDSEEMVKKRLSFIQEFSELGDYFRMPVSTYSSGMYSRLAFAVSMAFDYDYYLVDELISVGDQKFRKKAVNAFNEKRGKASTILVSHNFNLLKKECDIGVYLANGQAYIYESMDDAISKYLSEEQ